MPRGNRRPLLRRRPRFSRWHFIGVVAVAAVIGVAVAGQIYENNDVESAPRITTSTVAAPTTTTSDMTTTTNRVPSVGVSTTTASTRSQVVLEQINAATSVQLSPYQQQWQLIAPTKDVARAFHFQSPDGKVACTTFDADNDDLRCYVTDFTYPSPPRDDACTSEYAQWIPNYVSLNVNNAVPGLCTGDMRHEPQNATLNANTSISLGRFACVSTNDTVSCLNRATRHGFVVSQRNLDVY